MFRWKALKDIVQIIQIIENGEFFAISSHHFVFVHSRGGKCRRQIWSLLLLRMKLLPARLRFFVGLATGKIFLFWIVWIKKIKSYFTLRIGPGKEQLLRQRNFPQHYSGIDIDIESTSVDITLFCDPMNANRAVLLVYSSEAKFKYQLFKMQIIPYEGRNRIKCVIAELWTAQCCEIDIVIECCFLASSSFNFDLEQGVWSMNW